MMRATLVALLLAVPAIGAAQQTQHVDRIVAVVGTKPILASQLEEELVQQQAQGRQLPTDSAALAQLKRDFASVKHVKPAASRADSAELYLLATGFRGGR